MDIGNHGQPASTASTGSISMHIYAYLLCSLQTGSCPPAKLPFLDGLADGVGFHPGCAVTQLHKLKFGTLRGRIQWGNTGC